MEFKIYIRCGKARLTMARFNNKDFDKWVKDTMLDSLRGTSFITRAKNMSTENLDCLYEIICRKCCFRKTSETRNLFNELIKEA